MIRHLFIIRSLIILSLFAARAQFLHAQDLDSLTREFRPYRGISGLVLGVNGGCVVPHNEVVSNLLTGKKFTLINRIGWTWKADALCASDDDVMYGLPRVEVGLLVNDFSQVVLHRDPSVAPTPWESPLFDKSSSLGKMITPYFSANRALLRSRCVELGYKIEQGVGISTSPYDKIKNPENEMIGSRFSIMAGLGFYLDYRLSSRWSLGIEGDLHHYSNGRTEEPNIGVDPIDVGLHAVYSIRQDTASMRPFEWFRNRRQGQINYRKHFYFDVSGSLLPFAYLCEWQHTWYYTTPDDPRFRTGHFPKHYNATIDAALMYSYSPKYASGIGLEFLYSPTGKDIFYWESLNGTGKGKLQSDHGSSVVLHHEARYKSFGVHLGIGVYLKREPRYAGDVDLPFYQTVGLRYYFPILNHRLFASYNIRAHALTADAFQLSLGYSFSR